MTTKNTKKSANRNNAKNNVRNFARQNAENPQKRETAMTKQATPKKSVAQKTVAKKSDKKPVDASQHRIASAQIKIGKKIHTVTKRFRADKCPVCAVVVALIATGQPHVITWTRNESLARAHARRVARQYCTADATIEQRYANPVVVPVQIRNATPDDMTSPATTEDRTWIRVNRDAAGLNKSAQNSAANA